MIIEKNIKQEICGICENNEILSEVFIKYYNYRPYNLDFLKLVLEKIKLNNIIINLNNFISLEYANKHIDDIINSQEKSKIEEKPKIEEKIKIEEKKPKIALKSL